MSKSVYQKLADQIIRAAEDERSKETDERQKRVYNNLISSARQVVNYAKQLNRVEAGQ